LSHEFISEDEGDVSLPLQEEGAPSVLDEIRQGDVVIFERVGPRAVNICGFIPQRATADIPAPNSASAEVRSLEPSIFPC